MKYVNRKNTRKPSETIMLSDVIKDPSILFEDAQYRIIVDDNLQNESKGLLNKSISVNELRNIIHNEPKTLYTQAIKNFLLSSPNNRTVFPLDLPTEDLMNNLYLYQIDDDRKLTSRIYSSTIKSFYTNMKYEKIIPKHLWEWVHRNEYKKMLFDGLKKLISDSKKFYKSDKDKEFDYIIPNKIIDSLSELHTLLNNTKFTIHQGHAGCGKSSDVMKICNDQKNYKKHKMICSLSNTICNMFKQKVNDIELFSCSKASFFLKNDGEIKIPEEIKPINYDIVVLDEFSQWGFEWMDLLIELIKNNRDAEFHIMGDIDQIPTFLSSGSLLYTLMDSFPNNLIEYNTQYRFANNPNYRELINDILNNNIKDNTIINDLNDVVLTNVDCFITGTNKHVEYLNNKVVKKRFNIDNYINLWELCIKTEGDIPLIAKQTSKLVSGSKIYRNTRYKIDHIIPNDGVVMTSLVDGGKVKANAYELNYMFNLAYAITVNRSQGLEWDNVCCYITSKDLNLKNFNALYVALTRGKNNIIVATEDDDAEYSKMTIKDLNNILNIKYEFINNIKEIEDEK